MWTSKPIREHLHPGIFQVVVTEVQFSQVTNRRLQTRCQYFAAILGEVTLIKPRKQKVVLRS